MSELKCCPFCGGKAFLDTHRFWDEKAKDFTVQTYGVKCYDCQTGTWQHYRKEEDAIKRWNTRTPMANIVEKLEDEYVDCQKNMKDFLEWKNYLQSKGYMNYQQDLNSKNYGVAQSRKRTFMVSILGNYNYIFPNSIKLSKKLKDYIKIPTDWDIAGKWIKTEEGQKVIARKWAKINGDLCSTITARAFISYNCQYVEFDGGCRRLTPKEQWLLMDFTEDDFEEADSALSPLFTEKKKDNELSKQAGNSIVKNVLVAILGQMIPGKEDVYKKLETR